MAKRKLSETEERTEAVARDSGNEYNDDVKRIKTEAVVLDFMSVSESELIEVLEKYASKESVANHAQIALLLNTLTQRCDRFTLWSPVNFATLVGSVFSILKSHADYEPKIEIYEYLIQLLSSTEPSTETKSIRDIPHFEKSLTLLLKLVRASGDNLPIFQTAMVNVINRNSIYSVFNVTICTLVVGLLDIGSPQQLLQRFYQALKTAFSMFQTCREQHWIGGCLQKRICSWRLVGNLLRYVHISKYMSEKVACENLIQLAIYLMEKNTPPDHYNAYLIMPRTVSQSFSLLAASIQRELILDSHRARMQILTCLVSLVFDREDTDEAHRNHYIDQLEVLLNETFTIYAIYGSASSQNERNEINEFKAMLIELLCSDEAIDNLFLLEEKQAQRLIAAFRVFIYFDDKSDSLCLTIRLKKSLVERCNSPNASERVKATACRCLMVILQSVNKIPFKAGWNDLERINMVGLDRGTLLAKSRNLTNELIEFIRGLIIMPAGYSSANILTSANRLIRNVQIKSFVYQSMYSLIKANKLLVEKVCWFFSGILDRFVIKHKDHALLDMMKCVVVSSGSTEIELIEPLDVLVNCAILCMHKDSSNALTRIHLIIQTYLFKEPNYIYQFYRNQWRERLGATLTKTAVDFFDTHISQMILGLYNSTLEYLIKNEHFSDIPELMAKYESTKEMIQKDLHSFDSTCQVVEARTSKKRKLDESVAVKQESQPVEEQDSENIPPKRRPPVTRSKATLQDKENQPPASSSSSAAAATSKKRGRPALRNITNINTTPATRSRASANEATTSNSTPKVETEPQANTIKKASVGQSTRVAKPTIIRLSLASCIRAIRLSTATGTTSRFTEASNRNYRQTESSFSFNEAVIGCITNQPFMNLILGSIDQRLDSLLDESTNELYNPENLDDESLLNFLADLWSVYSQRINGSCRATSSIYHPDTDQFPHKFHLLNARLIHHCKLIWLIAGRRFQIEQDLLGVKKEGVMSAGGARFAPCEELRKFVANSLQMIQLYVKQPAENKPVASKCLLNSLSLLRAIFASMDFPSRDYELLITQFYQLCEKIKNDPESKEEAMKIIIEITCKANSPLSILKYMTLDFRNETTGVLSRGARGEAINERLAYWPETYNLAMKFITTFIKDQLVKFNEMLNTEEEVYNRYMLFKTLTGQFEIVVDIIGYLRRILSLTDELEQQSKVHKFKKTVDTIKNQLHEQITELTFHKDVVQIIGGSDNLFRLRELIETVSSQLNVVLTQERKRVKDLIVRKDTRISNQQ